MPAEKDITEFDEDQFKLYLKYVKSADFDHFHDVLYRIHETFELLQKTSPERTAQVLSILKEAGSGVVAELIENAED